MQKHEETYQVGADVGRMASGSYTQSLQNPLFKEYTLNYNRIPNMIYKVYSLIKRFWRLWIESQAFRAARGKLTFTVLTESCKHYQGRSR